MIALRDHLWGITGAVFAIIAVFFLRFYRDTKDRFFVLFALAFMVFAIHYWALAAYAVPDEARHLLYLARLLGFGLIVAAIIDKNRQNG